MSSAISISSILWGIAIVCVAWGALSGMHKKFRRSLVKLLGLVVSAVIAVLVVHKGYVDLADGTATAELLDALKKDPAMAESAQALFALEAELSGVLDLLILLVVSLLGPLSFYGIFYVVRFLVGIVCIIVRACLPIKKRNAVATLSGMFVGALRGALWTFILVFPLMGYAHMAVDAFAVTDPAYGENQTYVEISQAISEVADVVDEHPLTQIAEVCQGNKLFTYLTSFDYTTSDGSKLNVSWEAEAEQYAQIAADLKPLLGTKLESFDDPQVAALKTLAADIQDSRVISIVASEVLRCACTAWSQGETFLDKAKPVVDNESVQSILDTAIDTFKNTTPTSIGQDICSVADLFEVMVKYDVLDSLSNPDTLLDLMNNSEFLEEAITVLKDNERLEEVLKETVKTGVKAVVESAADEETFNQAVESLNQAAADQLNELASLETKEEQQAAVAEAITEVLVENNITQGSAVVDYVAELLVEEFADQIADGAVSAEDIAAYLGLYTK